MSPLLCLGNSCGHSKALMEWCYRRLSLVQQRVTRFMQLPCFVACLPSWLGFCDRAASVPQGTLLLCDDELKWSTAGRAQVRITGKESVFDNWVPIDCRTPSRGGGLSTLQVCSTISVDCSIEALGHRSGKLSSSSIYIYVIYIYVKTKNCSWYSIETVPAP